MPCVIADTSPLFYLAKLDRLALLRDLYGKVNVPPEVWRETLDGVRTAPELAPLFSAAKADGWLIVTDPPPFDPALDLGDLDPGEMQAIALARHLGADLLIMDERRGRAAATNLGLLITGTLGVLIDAKRNNIIPKLAPELTKLRRDTGFRFTIDLEQEALRLGGEAPPNARL